MTARQDAPASIDRSAATPLYLQLEQVIRGEIHRGTYRPGELLPSEAEICTRFDVSRSVVRHALQNLAHAGVIHTARGRGSFVAEEKLSERFVQRATGFYDDLTSLGLDIKTSVVARRVERVPLEVRDFLGVDEAVRIDRVRAVAGRVLAYVVTYLPQDRVPGLVGHDLTDRSLYAHLQATYGLRVHAGHRSVEAVPADDRVAHHLQVAPGAPLLLLRSAGRTADGRPLEWFEAWHRADRTRFEVEIVPDGVALPFQQAILATDRPAPRWTAEPAHAGEPAVPPPSTLLDALRRERCLAVVGDTSGGAGAAAAMAAGGVRIVAFAVTASDAPAAIAQATGVPDVLVGAASVRTLDQARRAVDAGARFLLAQVSAPALAGADLGVPVVLAGHTPTEVLDAHALTDGPVLLFPARTGGPAHLAAVTAALPGVPVVAAGGVVAADAAQFLGAGALAVAIDVPGEDAPALRRRAADLRSAISDAARTDS